MGNAVDAEDFLDHFLGQGSGLVGVDVGADDVAGVDVDHHVGVEVGALDRPVELGDVPRVHLPRAGGGQLRTGPGRVAGLAAAFLDLGVRGQDPIHRGW